VKGELLMKTTTQQTGAEAEDWLAQHCRLRAERIKASPGTLDIKGRCCGRKPVVHKKASRTMGEGPHRWCSICSRCYDLEINQQIPSSAWKQNAKGEWEHK
jgi:hypothetical protein